MVDLSASALAGLASTEDFTKIRLRKTAGPEEKEKNEYNGTKPVMLLHIKGILFVCVLDSLPLNKLTSVFYVSVVLLMMIFVIILTML